MNERELQALVEQISLQSFGRPFKHRVKINRRMRTTGGRYHLDDHHLEINAHFLTPEHTEDLVGIIKHELCHYHLHLLGLGYRHRDQDFKQLLKKVGGSRYAPDIGLRKKQQLHYLYRCQNCQREYPRVRRLNVRRYVCGKCHGKLRLVKKWP
ncbi:MULTISPECIES: SprT family protein [Lactobacillus]|uniref:Protein SprT-like n=1 Tax=Lactobacillus xujianguonis TaxID=2495899 RepID=A0A437SUC9_9LACO|nr:MULTISPECIES: SprT family protein [Lactobacillus]RVU70535.1 SprT family protein [Lactobacillus xujianguonis]RVU77032.1 SprT family protein [Lactobacillus xujianguonis]